MSGRRIFGLSFVVATFVLATAWNSNAVAAERAAGTSGTASSRSLDKLPSSAVTDQDIIAYINERIRQGWKDNELQPSKACTDAEWCRRVYLDVLGRTPAVVELEYFLAIKGNRKAVLIERLLEVDSRSKFGETAKDANPFAKEANSKFAKDYSLEFARNWTTVFTNMLIGRPKPAREEQRDMVDREGMQQYLRMSMLDNKPYDQLVYELVSATGTNKPGAEGYNGATNFLLDNLQEMAATATAKTARYFLGLQVQCTQCHNHPFNEWKQDQFWGMNAFFRQTKGTATRQGRAVDFAKLDNVDFRGDEGKTPEKAEIFYELRNGLLQVAYPTFVDGTKIDPNGSAAKVDRRKELAKLITKSEYFGKAIVNRMWGHFLGYGFTKPLDDIGPHNAPSHPELLERLGKEFAANDHDLRRLIRWCTLNEAYGLSSRFGTKAGIKNDKDDPSLGEKPMFSHFYIRQMQAEQLYMSLVTATEAEQIKDSYSEQEKIKAQWLQQFTLAFRTDEGDEATTFNGTIPQALMMMNGSLVKDATSDQEGSFLYKVATGAMSEAKMIDFLYQAALARKPTSAELIGANELLNGRKGNLAAALQDVWWALLNSNEFILIH